MNINAKHTLGSRQRIRACLIVTVPATNNRDILPFIGKIKCDLTDHLGNRGKVREKIMVDKGLVDRLHDRGVSEPGGALRLASRIRLRRGHILQLLGRSRRYSVGVAAEERPGWIRSARSRSRSSFLSGDRALRTRRAVQKKTGRDRLSDRRRSFGESVGNARSGGGRVRRREQVDLGK